MSSFTPTERTRVRRIPQRANYDRDTVYAILDEALICHVSFIVDGRPCVIPTGFGRRADTLFIHGSPASRMLRSLEKGIDVCVEVTLLDGLVLARSAFHHSMNYRSVVIFGTARPVVEPEEKMEALRLFTEHVAHGRWERVRTPSEKELKATLVLAIELDEVSAKVRTGPPIDDPEDMTHPVWAGVLPLRLVAGKAVPDAATPLEAAPHPTPSRFLP
jgi:nitroimidazol reductase NimA-like FMN-containing flavoprotein (pyridoxamine 5'-phosphate oxidase superfamily)